MEFNLADIFEDLAAKIPDHHAIVCGDRKLTYGALNRRANRLANWLSGQGIGPGDHIGVHLYNSVEYMEVFIAAFKLRAVAININYRYVPHELRYLFENGALKGLVHQRCFTPLVVEAVEGLSQMEVFLAIEDGSDDDLSTLGSVPFEQAMAESTEDQNFPTRSGEDLFILYTGGTTGMPRGVMWRHEDLYFAGLQGGNPGGDPIEVPEEIADSIVREERYPVNIHSAAPLIHGSAQLACWICIFTGGKMGLVPGRSFNPEASLKLIEDEEMNVINLVGDAMARPLADVLEANPDAYDLETLVALSSAGAILSDVVREQLERLMPDAMILNNFGSSETGHQGTAMYDDEFDGPRFFMDDNTTVFDENNKVVEPGSGQIGRLARSGHLPLGYWGDPVKTAKTFFEIDGKRWVMPGDMAQINDDGTIQLLGRGSICINTGGEKVFPEEVEEAFKSHPAVMDAICVGIPDDRWGERVTALVQLRVGHSATLEDLNQHVRTKVAGYKTPREIHLLDSLSRQPSGKPDYKWAKKKSIELSEG
jgi:acyl-CoA synthetase (AMP-forming)/AMP-acid ligase II